MKKKWKKKKQVSQIFFFKHETSFQEPKTSIFPIACFFLFLFQMLYLNENKYLLKIIIKYLCQLILNNLGE